MAKVFIEESSLTAIGEAIRSKTGKTDLLSPASMASEITSITTGGGGDVEEIVLTGDCSYACSNPAWNVLLDKVRTEGISNATSMFFNNYTAYNIPFEINLASLSVNFYNCFNASGIKTCPKINNYYSGGEIGSIFKQCTQLNDDIDAKIQIANETKTSTRSCGSMLAYCYSLRKAPIRFLNCAIKTCQATGYYSSPYYYMAENCYSLDELVGLYPTEMIYTTNAFSSTFKNCYRLKDFTFALDENGQPYVRNWKNQMIDLSQAVGANSSTHYILGFNSGITADKEVKDDATYQALKNDPDWFATVKTYSRYNHDSAVNTINSLPNCSGGSGNIIKFLAGYGAGTDGGAINTLTEEEIAVATAKGWTVSLVQEDEKMKAIDYKLTRYDADEGKVFDWKEPRFTIILDEEENEKEIQEHLYVKTLFIGSNDNIDNYIEVEAPVTEEV